MKRKLLLLNLFALTTLGFISTNQQTTKINESTFNEILSQNINENNYIMTHEKIIIEGHSLDAIRENYLLYLSNDVITNLVKYLNTHSFSQTVIQIYKTISNFKNVFNPEKPNNWEQIQQDIAKNMYYAIENCQEFSMGAIVKFGKLSIPGFPPQDWALVSTNPQA